MCRVRFRREHVKHGRRPVKESSVAAHTAPGRPSAAWADDGAGRRDDVPGRGDRAVLRAAAGLRPIGDGGQSGSTRFIQGRQRDGEDARHRPDILSGRGRRPQTFRRDDRRRAVALGPLRARGTQGEMAVGLQKAIAAVTRLPVC